MTTDSLSKKLKKIGWSKRENTYRSYISNIYGKNLKKSKISVVMICWRWNKTLYNAVKSLKKQTHKNYEFIFVDNGSPEGSLDWIREEADIFIRLKTNSGAYLARNIGSVFSESPIILFLEDDGISDQDLLKAHVETHHLLQEVVSVRGVYIPINNNSLNDHAKQYYHGWDVFSLYSSLEGNTSYKTHFFYEAGGWNDQIKFGHGGVDLSIRLEELGVEKWKHIYIPFALLKHDYCLTEEDLTSKIERQKQGHRVLLTSHPEWPEKRIEWHSFSGYIERKEILNKKFISSIKKLLKKFKPVKDRHSKEINNYTKKRFIAFDPESYKFNSHDKKIIIYGTGSKARNFYFFLNHHNIEVVSFIDSDQKRWGSELFGVPILSPLTAASHCLVIIASDNYIDIIKKSQVRNCIFLQL